jgi:hypothetical protein
VLPEDEVVCSTTSSLIAHRSLDSEIRRVNK